MVDIEQSDMVGIYDGEEWWLKGDVLRFEKKSDLRCGGDVVAEWWIWE